MQSVLQRDISECKVRNVPLNTLSESEMQEYSPQLRQLLAYVRPFRKQDFWTEVAIWERIYYKNVNQHRQSRCFKKFAEVRTLFKRLKEVDPSSILAKLCTSFYEGNPLTKSKGAMTSLPTIEYIDYSLHRMISAALLLDRIQVVCMETYRSHQHLLNKKFFLPLTLVIMSLCCRVYSCCKQWGAEIEDFYDFMNNWKDKFASSPETASICYDIDKDTLRHARRAASEELYLRRASDYQPVHLESGNISLDIHQVKAELSLRETVDEISKHSGIDVMDEDYGEILSRGDEQVPSISKEFTDEQGIVAIVENQDLEMAQKTEKKRKASNEIGTDFAKVQKTVKSTISKLDKVKPKKKKKATVEARDKHDGANSNTSNAVQESEVKNSNVNSNIDTKPKTKSKTKRIQAKQSKGNSKDEIDDIFGF